MIAIDGNGSFVRIPALIRRAEPHSNSGPFAIWLQSQPVIETTLILGDILIIGGAILLAYREHVARRRMNTGG